MKAHPLVSVVIPVLNAARELRRCLDALVLQSWPAEATEIIVCDNGSHDDMRTATSGLPVHIVEEVRFRSPYAARNTAVRASHGEILAFTDASCIPAPNWIEAGVAVLSNVDLVGGRVDFDLAPRPGPAEIVDALFNLDMEAAITKHRACMTGNLFARRQVMDSVGPFVDELRSGGDQEWTRRATDAGFRIAYSDDVRVTKTPRSMRPLLAKQIRVGRGVPSVGRTFGWTRAQIVNDAIRGLMPPPPRALSEAFERRGRPEMDAQPRAVLWAVRWACKVARSAGIAAALLGGGERS